MNDPTASFAAIGLVVEDLARALAFYRLLGLAVPEADSADGHAEVALPGGLRLMLDSRESALAFEPDWRAPEGSPRASFAFAAPSVEAVDATFAGLVVAGASPRHEPWDAAWGQRYATLLDPDGNGIDLFCALPTN